MVVVPRLWLIGLLALVLVPWLIAGAVYSRSGPVTPNRPTTPAGDIGAGATPDAASKDGPHGQLVTTPLVISPPLEYVPTDWGPLEPPTWRFPDTTPQELVEFLSSSGLPREQVDRLAVEAQPDRSIQGLIVRPDPRLVRNLDPQVRAHIYFQLALSPLNPRQRDAYRHFGTTAEAWLGSSLISPDTRRLVEPLIYRRGDFLYFADIDLVRPDLKEPAELQRLAKALLREATTLVSLRLEASSQVDGMSEYWGRGGRRTDIRPLLESVAIAPGPHSIDISHLLPSFARQHLYRYPRVTLADLEKTTFVNCFWTALNFFNQDPDDRYLDERYAIEHLKRDYFIVHDGLQLGDIAAFAAADGTYFHAAVYLAEGLVFGKNGNSPLAPWTILPIERLRGYYPEHEREWRVVYYRRKDL